MACHLCPRYTTLRRRYGPTHAHKARVAGAGIASTSALTDRNALPAPSRTCRPRDVVVRQRYIINSINNDDNKQGSVA